jgi:hypothetical protein
MKLAFSFFFFFFCYIKYSLIEQFKMALEMRDLDKKQSGDFQEGTVTFDAYSGKYQMANQTKMIYSLVH